MKKQNRAKQKGGTKNIKKILQKRWVKKHPKTLNQKCSNQR